MKSKTNITKNKEKKPRIPKKITESYLHNSGLYYLERFAASSEHFRKVMLRKVERSCFHHKDQNKQDCMEMVDQLVNRFRTSGLLDDETYTRGTVTSLRRRGLSARAIQNRLKQKGLPDTLIQKHLSAIDEECGDDSELCAALRLIKRRRLGAFQTTEKENAQEKALASLARSGFSYDIAIKALNMTQKEALDLINNYRL